MGRKSLDIYRKKRVAGGTPEPFGGQRARPGLFVVQKHAARRLHYDFRIELDGVLRSFAVPKGPSLDPAHKRLAVAVEDHPLEYADFEGVIPKDNYGAGEVIVWDRGMWIPLEDPHQSLDKGKLTFELRGYKLRGAWHLFRLKDSVKDWMLVKRPDGFASSSALPEESILSGLTIEELREGARAPAAVRAELEAARVPRHTVHAKEVRLMLAKSAERPFSRDGWWFELKYDGYRLLAGRTEGGAELVLRGGGDAARLFPELTSALARLPARLLLDGEVVVPDDDGRPNFGRLQKRAQPLRPLDRARAAIEHPAVYYAFDLLGFEDFDLRGLPLWQRQALLARLVPRLGPVRLCDHVEGAGEALYAEVERRGLEGVMAKRADAPYRAGRSADWLKMKAERTGDFVIVGFTEPKGSRAGIGALHLACHDGQELVYCGRVGSGLDDRQLAQLRAELEELPGDAPPCRGAPTGRQHHYVDPKRVCEVRFHERTADGLLRQPVFLRLRDDKQPDECVFSAPSRQIAAPLSSPAAAAPRAPEVAISNPDKIFWPEAGYTKGDLIAYYRAIAPFILPFLRDRPLVLTRYPDGITGKSFFQKDAPGFVPAWLRTERMWSEHAAREVDAFVCDDEASLVYLVNLGTIPLHVWSSRTQSLAQPDWCVLDLDPKQAPFAHVVTAARAIYRLCEELGLPSHIKTSGQAGLHVLIPLSRQCTHEQSRALGQLLCRVIADELPQLTTLERSLGARGGRVYLDYLQNGHGKTIASVYSVRPVPGALVSTPLRWSEVNAKLDPRRFTLRTVPARARRMKDDPLASILTEVPDLPSALAKLGQRLDRR